jgi:hypothetical protein
MVGGQLMSQICGVAASARLPALKATTKADKARISRIAFRMDSPPKDQSALEGSRRAKS